ncbi:nitronate monooxygenase [uncultured Lactobacillus sp.]|uniref:nitronate monooxygenase n=1 Tax=uncultured Lactobacillus sp. TaxID=153152 RepID=UPI0025D992DC|nr:nitronate monooxygenase [uncultured Lactobacillus sp.]
MTNRVEKILGIKKPVIQGAMAFTSLAPLVSAVSNAGGLGVLGVGYMPKDASIVEIEKTKKLTNKPFAVNVIMQEGLVEQADEVLEETQPPVVYADAMRLNDSLCQKYFPIWQKKGMKIIVKASYLKDAITAEKAGANLVIAKGWEGGGHVSFESTMALVPQIVNAISVPIIAAGGIVDGRSGAAAFALGAEGIEMGTAFLVSDELSINSRAKDAIIAAGDMSTVEVSYANDAPFRMIANKLSEQIRKTEATHLKKAAAEKEQGLDADAIRMGMYQGDTENGAIMVGQDLALIKSRKSAKQIIDDVLGDTRKVLDSLNDIEF